LGASRFVTGGITANFRPELKKKGKLTHMQDYKNILQALNEILIPFVPPNQYIDDNTDLIADLGLDSLKVMKILESVEDRFDISIPLNVLPDVRTVKDFVLQIQKLNRDE
jgi:acyl carrier protein